MVFGVLAEAEANLLAVVWVSWTEHMLDKLSHSESHRK